MLKSKAYHLEAYSLAKRKSYLLFSSGGGELRGTEPSIKNIKLLPKATSSTFLVCFSVFLFIRNKAILRMYWSEKKRRVW